MLSQNDKILNEKIFEDCEIVVKKFVGELKFKATITSKISEEFPILKFIHYKFHANFVS